jgi:hypothetical protein
MQLNPTLDFKGIHSFLTGLFDGDLHAKRVLSLANAGLGVIRSGSLAVHAIGLGLAQARGLKTKHAVKQVDRLLSNEGIDVDAALRHWVPYVVGPRTSINVAMDWTDFDADGQATIMLSLLTRNGRATPLMWLTVDTATLKNHRNEYEYQVLVRLADALPADITVCIVADRGFGDQKLYHVLTQQLNFDYVIRFRGNITVTALDGETRTAAAWVGPGGRAKVLRGAQVTADRYQVGTVLCVRDKDMKQAWCLATSRANSTASNLKGLYGKRWEIECGFRDTKDLRFGMGMASIRHHVASATTGSATRRRSLFIVLPAHVSRGERSHNAWFRPNECRRLLYDVLRDAPTSPSTRELTEQLIALKVIPAIDDRQRLLIQKTILGSLNAAKETIERVELAGVVRWRLR